MDESQQYGNAKFRGSGGVFLKKNLFFFWDLRFLGYVPGYAQPLKGKSRKLSLNKGMLHT